MNVDKRMLKRARKALRAAQQFDDSTTLVTTFAPYNGTDLLVASARECHDGPLVTKFLRIAGATVSDVNWIYHLYNGTPALSHLPLAAPPFVSLH